MLLIIENKVRESLEYSYDSSMTKIIGIFQQFSNLVFFSYPFFVYCCITPVKELCLIQFKLWNFYTKNKKSNWKKGCS